MSAFHYGKSLSDRKYYFNLRDNNNEIILTSNQGYETEQGCLDGIAAVKKYSTKEECFVQYTGRDSQYYFHLTATNGEVIGQSEGYRTSSGRDRGMENCKIEAPKASLKQF